MDFDRPKSAKLQQNQEPDTIQNRSNLGSPTLSALHPSVLLPIFIQQPLASSSGSPISTPLASNRHKSNITIRTPSSSGVSSASSSTTSPNISKSINDNNRFQYVAIFDYDARTKDDLTIRKSDLLEIINRKSTAWWKAKNENGNEGWIPSNYVAKRDSLESEPYDFIIFKKKYRNYSFLLLDGILNLYVELMLKNSLCQMLMIMEVFLFETVKRDELIFLYQVILIDDFCLEYIYHFFFFEFEILIQ